jgi:hypothetical protein
MLGGLQLFRFTLRIKVALFHCVVTPVSAIVRKLEKSLSVSTMRVLISDACVIREQSAATAFDRFSTQQQEGSYSNVV